MRMAFRQIREAACCVCGAAAELDGGTLPDPWNLVNVAASRRGRPFVLYTCSAACRGAFWMPVTENPAGAVRRATT